MLLLHFHGAHRSTPQGVILTHHSFNISLIDPRHRLFSSPSSSHALQPTHDMPKRRNNRPRPRRRNRRPSRRNRRQRGPRVANLPASFRKAVCS
jgi:hypothetical protein